MSLDAVDRELIWNGLTAVAQEMAIVEYRSSFSPVIREMLDYSCSVLDAEGRLLADAATIPAQVGTVEFALAGVLERLGPLDEGDVVLMNDPYHGATHLPDIEIFMPVHHRGRLLGYTVTVAHHVDVGGSAPHNRGTIPGQSEASLDIIEEGLLFPATKLYSRGVRNEAVWELILANVRDPDMSTGDFGAQVSACVRGVERMGELADRFGYDAVREAMAELVEDTSRRTKAVLDSWPTREVTAIGRLDGDGLNFREPVEIVVRLRVVDGVVEVDLSDSAAQVPGPTNIPWASTHAAVYYGVKCFLRQDLRQNHGYMRHIRLTAPEGLVVRPRRPAAVDTRHLGVQLLSDIVFRALGDLLPDLAVASSHVSFPMLHVRAYDERLGRHRTMLDMVGGGGGARPGGVGESGIDSYTSNCAQLPAEVVELDYPWRIVRTELVGGSGGAGRWEGGLGIRREYELLGERAFGLIQAEQQLPASGASGASGGGRGAPAAILIRRAGSTQWTDIGHEYNSLSFSRGDVLAIVAAGGGGYGPPDEAAGGANPSVRQAVS